VLVNAHVQHLRKSQHSE